MKRDIYAYFTTIVLIAAVGFSVFLVVSDNRIPFTTQATLKTTAIEVTPEVSGYIKTIFVAEGDKVSAGTPLIQLDPTDYEINKQKMDAGVLKSKAQWQLAKRHLTRLQALYKSKSVSKEVLDDAESAVQDAYSSLLIQQAEQKKAQRDLDKTLIVAKQAGTVTNLSYRVGMYVTSTSPVIYVIDQNSFWLAADFTEKGLSSLSANRQVNIVFDADPMTVHQGHIVSVDSAILSGVSQTNQLAQVDDETRWIRPQQKIRVRISPDIEPGTFVAGSRASVMVRDNYAISDTWMTMLSWMRYIY
ncbi:HlyD family secretion protein [Vibrio sp. MA40-2]|uniref:HlyD family secretion protein n=1 Tax=Vibrio sp. MA40-2 TaxID=3391828 RepID=UPI0039A49482